MTYKKVIDVEKTAISTGQQVALANKRFVKILSISDISKTIKVIQEIQVYLKSKSYEAALVRMKDLKSIMIELKHKKEITTKLNIDNHNTHLTNLSIHITNINKSLVGEKKGFNSLTIISDLEEIEDQLSDINAQLKFISHD